MTGLRLFDLNLLIAFDALMAERNVTRAAHRVGIGQPAMSYALSRLRELFGDDLFVRTSSAMQPTTRALEPRGSDFPYSVRHPRKRAVGSRVPS